MNKQPSQLNIFQIEWSETQQLKLRSSDKIYSNLDFAILTYITAKMFVSYTFMQVNEFSQASMLVTKIINMGTKIWLVTHLHLIWI